MVKDRLKKKASEKEAKKAAQNASLVPVSAVSLAEAEAAMAALLNEEATKKKSDSAPSQKKKGSGKK
jgi:hypothetical protein